MKTTMSVTSVAMKIPHPHKITFCTRFSKRNQCKNVRNYRKSNISNKQAVCKRRRQAECTLMMFQLFFLLRQRTLNRMQSMWVHKNRGARRVKGATKTRRIKRHLSCCGLRADSTSIWQIIVLHASHLHIRKRASCAPCAHNVSVNSLIQCVKCCHLRGAQCNAFRLNRDHRILSLLLSITW